MKGDLILFTERIPCHSCMRIIEEFKTNNPDLDMTVTFMYGTELHGKLTDDDRGKVKQLNEIGIFVNLVCQASKRKQVKPKAEGSQESLD